MKWVHLCKVVVEGSWNENKNLPWPCGGNAVMICSSRQDQRVMPIRHTAESEPDEAILNRVSVMEPSGACFDQLLMRAAEGDYRGQRKGCWEGKRGQTSGRLINGDFRANAASLLTRKVIAILKVSRVTPARRGTVRVGVWRARSSCRENSHAKNKWSVWRRWNHVGQLSKPIWMRSAGWKCPEPEISAAESHRSLCRLSIQPC